MKGELSDPVVLFSVVSHLSPPPPPPRTPPPTPEGPLLLFRVLFWDSSAHKKKLQTELPHL